MTRGRKTGGRDFKKGQSGNPTGNKPLPPEIKQARSLNRLEVEALLTKYLRMPFEELEAVTKDPRALAIDRLVAGICHTGIKFGDATRLNFLLDRLIGKVKEPTQDFNFNFQMLPRAQVIEMGKEAIKVLKAADSGDDDVV